MSITDSAELVVLLVDDEVNILNSLRRLLRKQPWQLLFADSGEQALAMAEAQPVDLIVSDARMPGMDGATLLAEMQKRQPDCVRIMLTGHADMDTTIRAINDGRIYRYVSKPWDDDELLITLRQSLALRISERERKRLEKLTRLQNRQLRELNESLEAKVQQRTAELRETADMLDLAYAELKHSYFVATQVFASMLQQRLPRERQTNDSVISLTRAWAQARKMDPLTQENLLMAAALYNIGKLGWDDAMLLKSTDMLYKHDLKAYRSYPVVGESFLMALEPMQDAARLIRHHMERWDGQGFPDRLEGDEIPLAAQMLRLVVDFVELQAGMVLDHPVQREQALGWIKRYRGKLYQPVLTNAFIRFCDELLFNPAEPAAGEVRLSTLNLQPGMELSRDLYAGNGLLLLNAGKILTQGLIDKLQTFEQTEDLHYALFLRDPQATSDQPEQEVAHEPDTDC